MKKYDKLTLPILFLIIKEITNKDVSDVTLRFVDDLGFDSMDVVTFLSILENDYDEYIEDKDVPDLHTVQDVITFCNL